MPDGGMWHMTEFKRCSGHKGYWACADDYPDRMVPFGEFGKYTLSPDGLQPMCRRCMSYRISFWNAKVSAAERLVGSQKEFRAMSKEERDKFFAQVDKANLLNTAPAQEVIAFIESTKSEFGQSKPMTKRTITKVEGEKVPEGWVYVVRNPDVPSILKIGKTFPDGIPDIMSSARRFGRAELIHKCWFNEAYRSEQSIHKVLRKYNLRVLGYTDCGKELFECSIDIAMSAILAECSDTEDAA